MDVVFVPTWFHLNEAMKHVKNNIHVGSEDISEYRRGAFSGAVTAHSIKDLGMNWTLIGHS